MSFVIRPVVNIKRRVCREPGDTDIEIPGATCFPSRACATTLRSRNDEFTLLPTATWATSVPATSRTAFTLSGLDGHAMSGSIVLRSTSTVSSYAAPSSAARGLKSFPRACAPRNCFVMPSAGKTDAVAPSSVPMFAIVPRDGTLSSARPGPVYSRTLFFAHLTSNRFRSSRITSFALTHGLNFPASRTFTTAGIVRRYGSPAIALATSKPPAPIASIPHAPAWGVWESHPSIVSPGMSNRSMWAQWLIPFPGPENRAPYRWQTLRRKR